MSVRIIIIIIIIIITLGIYTTEGEKKYYYYGRMNSTLSKLVGVWNTGNIL